MNNIDFTQPGGLPFDQGILAFLQDSILLASQAATLGGTLCILSGCVETGQNVSPGFVAINGEILPFQGGTKLDTVVIIETVSNLQYFDAVSRPVKKTRIATFGNDGVTNFLWASFKRNTSEGVLARLETMEAKAAKLERIAAVFLPVGENERGGMVLWKKPANLIPAGWQEVVDWRGRLPIGYNPGDAAFDVVGEPGGNKSHNLTKGQLPKYNIVVPGMTGGDNNDHSVTGRFAGGDKGATESGFFFNLNVDNGGNNEAFSLLNPYRVVMFIEYIGE